VVAPDGTLFEAIAGFVAIQSKKSPKNALFIQGVTKGYRLLVLYSVSKYNRI